MHLFHKLIQRIRFIGSFGLLGLLVALLAVFAQPLKYGAHARLLVIQRSTLGLDPYTAVKSAERIADTLSLVMYSEDFFTKTLRQDPSIDQTKFPADQKKRRREWKKIVRTSLVGGTGLMTVTALSSDPDEAVKIAQAIADVLTVSGREYVGGDLEVKLVDSPLPTAYPISPNIPFSLALGLLTGLLVGASVVFWREGG